VAEIPEPQIRPKTAAPSLSVVVPVHNGGLQLSRCLEALRASEYESFEVIVVDDCSTDNTQRIIERYHARYLRTPWKMGPAGARNLGAQHAAGEILVFVDADVVVPPGSLGLIAADFESDPELAAVFGSYDEAPAWRDFLSQYKNLMHHYVHQVSSERAVTFWAGCGAIRKEVFEEFGGFDAAKYPHPSIEDIELGYRLAFAERKIRLNKQLQVKHLKRWTVRGLLRADILYRAVPWARLIIETRNLPRDLNLTYASRVSAGLTGLLFLGILVLPLAAGGYIRGIRPWALCAAMVTFLGILIVLNWHVYAFFRRKRGWRFTVGAVLAHWFYYLSSGFVFFILGLSHLVRSPFARASRQGPEMDIRRENCGRS
jgi:glycosyltransferase involved in cell wall biosynthesis